MRNAMRVTNYGPQTALAYKLPCASIELIGCHGIFIEYLSNLYFARDNRHKTNLCQLELLSILSEEEEGYYWETPLVILHKDKGSMLPV